MSDNLVKRLLDTQEINPTANLRREAAAALVAKDAENARLLGLLREAEELTDAVIDPRHGSKADWDWRDAVLARLRGALSDIAETSTYTRLEWAKDLARNALLAASDGDEPDDDWKADLSLMQYNALNGGKP